MCLRCSKKFDLVVRKHHCRRCGYLCCGDCTKHRVTFESGKRARICNYCFSQVGPPHMRSTKDPKGGDAGDDYVVDSTPPPGKGGGMLRGSGGGDDADSSSDGDYWRGPDTAEEEAEAAAHPPSAAAAITPMGAHRPASGTTTTVEKTTTDETMHDHVSGDECRDGTAVADTFPMASPPVVRVSGGGRRSEEEEREREDRYRPKRSGSGSSYGTGSDEVVTEEAKKKKGRTKSIVKSLFGGRKKKGSIDRQPLLEDEPVESVAPAPAQPSGGKAFSDSSDAYDENDPYYQPRSDTCCGSCVIL